MHMLNSMNYSERKLLNLMCDTPKKPGKKSGKKAKQREASDYCWICRINVRLNVGVFWQVLMV